ncbi:uncharacterized protein BXZ73DRAFT_98105 [Epithele typhae]|uniref:uncharacterized protein n=1 Tax=Epithele typhae TaxID=378194 RepID=UPI0020077DA3|nr:uncharacterized protein BXZ73DRAFT_98105 [Epithele typhae]KAH9941712.1 hypothetical protein BXZ73DRAFT_98105 [Epithele typhae]
MLGDVSPTATSAYVLPTKETTLVGVTHTDAERATARAASALGIPLILSGAASRSLEQVAEANSPLCSVLVVTVDITAIGWRYLDLDSGFLSFAHRLGIQPALLDPKFMEPHGAGAAPHTDESDI